MTHWTGRLTKLLAVAALALAGCESGSDDESGGIHSSGAATIRGTFDFDFDEGTGGTVPVPANHVQDVFWRRHNVNDSELSPQNGAQFTPMGGMDFNGVTRAQVAALALSQAPVPDGWLPVGTVVAYRTSDGRFGKFRINGFSGNQDMAISWVTWE